MLDGKYMFLGLIFLSLSLLGDNEIINKQTIASYIPRDPIILEAGAHNGSDTFEMSQLWPTATIYAFEPVPNLFAQLKNRTENSPNINCFPWALSDRRGKAELYVSTGQWDASSSLLEPKDHLIFHPHVVFDEKITVETITVDEWAEMNNVSHIDVLWLDVQGHELTVLQSMPAILKTVSVILTEVNLRETYKGNPLYPELRDWLEDQGFHVVMEEFWEIQGNVLFVRDY